MLPQDTIPGKRCTKCGETKPLNAYYVKNDSPGGRLFSWCKVCHREMCAARYVPAPPRPKPSERLCVVCERWLPISDFHRKGDGHRYRCKACRNGDKAAYRAARADAIKAGDAAYRAARRVEIAERQRAWRAAHPERIAAIVRQSKRKHRDRVNAETHRRRARIKGNGGSWTVAEWAAIKDAQGQRCLMCGERRPLTVDHIIPISMGGPNVASNIQGLCKSCNSKKHRKALDLRR